MELSAVFLDSLPAHGGAYRAVPSLEALLTSLTGRAPGVEPRAFVRHLAARLPPSSQPEKTLRAIHAEDLALALRCASGAFALLEPLLDRVARAVARLDESGALADEVKQVLREKLLLPDGARPPRILDYAGQGPLLAWLKAAALRHALNLKRPRARDAAESEAKLAALPAAQSPELELIRVRHHQQFSEAFAAAMASLTPRERTLLKLHVLDGLPLERIGALYAKDKSTVSRWLSTAHQRLERQTRAHLVRTLQLTPGALESVLRAAQSQLSLSLSLFLQRT